MAQEERYGSRDRTYSAWHRRKSTMRFVGIEKAQNLAMIDLDAALYIEYDDGSKEPLAIIETARDVGQEYKSATVTRNLARRAGLHAYVVLYRYGNSRLAADPKWQDIDQFRVMRLWPSPTRGWVILTPAQWAAQLVAMRTDSAAELDALLEDGVLTE